MGMSLFSPMKFSICDICNMFCEILIQYFTQNLFIFYVNYIQYDHWITIETIIWLCSYIKEIYVLCLKT